jgi:hypothetical protein
MPFLVSAIIPNFVRIFALAKFASREIRRISGTLIPEIAFAISRGIGPTNESPDGIFIVFVGVSQKICCAFSNVLH